MTEKNMKVIKFGGSSLADAKQIKKVCHIVLDDPARRIVVVSAPGKRFPEDTKVTDLLIALAETHLAGKNDSGELQAVLSRYESIASDLSLDKKITEEIREDLEKRLHDDADPEKFMDRMKAAGEDNTAKLVAAYLISTGVNAEYVSPLDAGMILSEEYGNARVLPQSYELLAKLAERKTIMIFPGFFGYSQQGDVVTFSRGGSDVTGGILAAAIQAELYENFTDVDSVYAANPHVVENPCPIPLFTYEEMRELSYGGFTVLHEEALAPVYRKGIPVNIKNTNNPTAPGTMIVPQIQSGAGHSPVVGIAADKGFLTIHVQKYMMNREIGFGRKLLQILEEEQVSYEHTPSGIDSISVIVRERNVSGATLDRMVKKMYNELQVDQVIVEKNQAIVMLVGQGMNRSIGLAGRATIAFAKAGINLKMINQGSSEVSIMFGVEEKDAAGSVRALYQEFFGSSLPL